MSKDDPVEHVIASALTAAGVAFTREGDKAHPDHRLDFHLTDENVAIECKWDHSPRSIAQLSRRRDVILIQGVNSALLFADAIRGYYVNPKPS